MFSQKNYGLPDSLIEAARKMKEGDLDPVNKKALKKKFDDRKDKDIDNDGDSDDSDEYLHKRRKAISKAVKDDKEELDEKCKSMKKESEDEDKDGEEMTDAQKKDMDGDGEKDSKKKKKDKDSEMDSKPDKIDTEPETMVAEKAGLEERSDADRLKSLDDPETNKMFPGYKKMLKNKMRRKDAEARKHASRRSFGPKDDETAMSQAFKKAKNEEVELEERSTEDRLKSLDDPEMAKQFPGAKNILKRKIRNQKSKDAKHASRRSFGSKDSETTMSLAMKKAKNEEVELDEKRGRPAKGDDADTNDTNLIMQLRKAVSLKGRDVSFTDGSKTKVSAADALSFLNRFNKLRTSIEKDTLMKSAMKSPKHFKMALQGKVAKEKDPLALD